MKRQTAYILCMMLFLFTGCAAPMAKSDTSVTIEEPKEAVTVGNVRFGWLPERMQEAERVETDGFCYVLFLGVQDSTEDYVAFFYKELEPTGSGKITGTRLEIEDLEQEALDNGGELLKEILDAEDSSVWWTTVEGDENGENRYMLCIRTHEDGWEELSKIKDQLVIE